MNLDYEKWTNKIYLGDALSVLKKLPSNLVNCIVTSPPYYRLRDYQVEGQIGLEDTPQEYIERLVDVFREARRVLRDDGALWLNLGDTYYSGKGEIYSGRSSDDYTKAVSHSWRPKVFSNWLRHKQLLLIPPRVAIAMQEDGWLLRNVVVWEKTNPMPSCLSEDTEIYIRENNQVKVLTLGALYASGIEGKEILTPHGWKRIRKIWKVKKEKYLQFRFGSSSEVKCSLDHRFPVSHDNRRKNYEVKKAKDFRDDPHRMLDRLLFVPIGKFLEGNIKEIYGVKLDYELGRFLGLIVAEGGFNAPRGHQCKITLSREEKETLSFFTNVLKERFNQYFSIYEMDNYVSCLFSSLLIRKLYEKVCKGKCKEKELNLNFILNTPLEFRQGLFDGIIEGDGHYDENGRISYGTASEALRNHVYLLASSIGLLASRHPPIKRLDKRTQKVYTLYPLTIPLSLQREVIKGEMVKMGYYNRKLQKYIPSKYRNEFYAKTLKITNIKVEKTECELIDLEVEGGLFLINGGLVTHNSVKDRLSCTWEYMFFFVKNEKYYFDLDAIRVPHKSKIRQYGIRPKQKASPDSVVGGPHRLTREYHPLGKNPGDTWSSSELEEKFTQGILLVREAMEQSDRTYKTKYTGTGMEGKHFASREGRIAKSREVAKAVAKQIFPDSPALQRQFIKFYHNFVGHPFGKNPGDIWKLPTASFKEAHFAVFPSDLVKRPILATCPRWICKKCDRPRERVVKIEKLEPEDDSTRKKRGRSQAKMAVMREAPSKGWLSIHRTVGWTDCGCNVGWRKGIVLDPFCGSGTTLYVAQQLGRSWIGIDIKPEYVEMSKRRISKIYADDLSRWI